MTGFFRIALMAGVAFGAIAGSLFSLISRDITLGVVFGVVAGAVFGLVLAAFAGQQRAKFRTQDRTLEGERLLKQGPANHFRRGEAVGGYLYLTDARLLFRSHRFNIQNHELSIPLQNIRDARPCMTAFVVPNGLRVVTDRDTERLVVEDRRSWAEAIRSAAANPKGRS